MKLTNLATEKRNQHTAHIDTMSTKEILNVINKEDMTVAQRVQQVLPQVEKVVDAVSHALSRGGKLFYVGAGTSGRIGIMDAVECPPTFSTSPELVQAVMAGGTGAFVQAVEGAEDEEERGIEDLEKRNITDLDVVIGIAASGRTPYVIGALKHAKKVGAVTVSLSSNLDSAISKFASIPIEVETGPEVLTGSTRMKAATAHKMILNMITTTSMIKIGKVYENLMVDVKVSNKKLKDRAISIVSTITNVAEEKATEILEITNFEVKPAIVMLKANVSFEEAQSYITQEGGFVREAIERARKEKV
ncbi:N-acetylmuramic acid 6-phosphate etherase [Virgibacillus halodenitrificans]|uniref:N-acetylmuramic acid 6-phosphate etherase n=1 Tax=Virgibacillus halodenitrificans TaxID=1482 RepID=UPI00136D0731|nr:N-acetylmuramic acid 6-phosphate etherase [Virgibacillus halodenitrificans]MCJ0929906.1 N-acetylmuramic acid 6-phosphate etherase [Virgibacillus halodenitrificans]MYL46517.1 N-acetylmuramic acid 6-phosphate etherase [Virgibacillus halodenitrificans]